MMGGSEISGVLEEWHGFLERNYDKNSTMNLMQIIRKSCFACLSACMSFANKIKSRQLSNH
jgi:hypothetical protein